MQTLDIDTSNELEIASALSLPTLIETIVGLVKKALGSTARRPVKPLPRLPPSTAPTSAKRLALVLDEMKCKQLTTELFEGVEEMVVTGVAFSDALVPHVIGPYKIGNFTRVGETKAFDPPGELVTFELGAAFPQNAHVVATAVEFDGHEGPGIVAAILELATKILKAEQGKLPVRLDPVQVLTIIGQVYGQVVNTVGLFTQSDEIFAPDSHSIRVVSATAPFGPGKFVSREATLAWHNRGLLQFGRYDGTVSWVAR